MSPLSAIAVSRLAGQAMVTAGRAASDTVVRFADVFAEAAAGSEEIASGAVASGIDEAGSIGEAIIERIRGLLAQASLPGDQPLGLELSPLGDIYVSTDSAPRGDVEAAVDRDSQLRELLSRWTSLTGQQTFQYSGAKNS